MAAKTSAEMREALRLVMSGGMTGRDAAKHAGVREESLYRRPEYREWRAEKKPQVVEPSTLG